MGLAYHSLAFFHIDLVSEYHKRKVIWIPRGGLD